jgi:hypothetical protein
MSVLPIWSLESSSRVIKAAHLSEQGRRDVEKVVNPNLSYHVSRDTTWNHRTGPDRELAGCHVTMRWQLHQPTVNEVCSFLLT